MNDLAETIEGAKGLGIEVDWLVSDEHGPAVAFLSPDALFGVNIELVRKEPRINLQASTGRDQRDQAHRLAPRC